MTYILIHGSLFLNIFPYFTHFVKVVETRKELLLEFLLSAVKVKCKHSDN